MKGVFLFALSLCWSLLLFSQNPPTVPTIQTPTVAALNKYIDFPVDKGTGVMNIDIPLYTVDVNGFKIPISISYHANGIKVEEQASNFGLGWALNCGGVISRSVKGNRADEYGYWYYRGPASHAGAQYAVLQGDIDHYQYLGEIPGSSDTEADVFYFSFNGYSGKFVFDSSRGINLVPEQDVKFEVGSFYGDTSYTFKATTPDGTQYFFGSQNSSKALYIDGDAGDPIITAWNLDKIITPDLKTITFEYEEEGQDALRSLAHESYPFKKNVCPLISYITNSVDVHGQRVKKISSDNTEVRLIYKSSLREDYYSASTYRAIDSIKVFDKTSGNLIKALAFATSYFQSTAPNLVPTTGAGGGAAESFLQKRLRLDSLWECGIYGGTLPAYKFFYNKHDTTKNNYLPTRLSLGQDAWGYYNGKDSNSSLYPTLRDPTNSDSIACNTGNDRSVHEEYAQAFILDEIGWPTGGKTIYNYECAKDTDNTIVGGGLRIKQITHIADASQLPIIKTYTYYSPTVVGHSPNFTLPIDDGSLPLDEEHYDFGGCTFLFASGTDSYGWGMAFTDPVITSGEFFSTYVYYGEVIEKQSGNGSIESYYDVASVNDEVSSNYDNDDYPLIAGTQSVILKSGKLVQEITKKEDGNPIKTVNYSYGTTGRTINAYSYKLYRPFCWQRYKLSGYGTGSVFLLEKTESMDGVIDTTDYVYGGLPSHHFVTQEITRTSDGKVVITKYKYPKDYSSGGFISTLNSKYMIGTPIEKTVSKNGGIVSGEITTYKNSEPVIDTIFKIETATPIDTTTFSPSSISGSSFTKNSNYKPQFAMNRYDPVKNVSEYQKINDAKTSFIWDYNRSYPVAKVNSADSSSIAFTSFEADGSGNWSGINSSYIEISGGITGNKCYNQSSFSLSKSGLTSTVYYIVSYWSKNGSYTISGNQTGYPKTLNTISINGSTWTLYEHLVTGQTTITVSGSGAIDELRLYPKGAQMTTYTYTPLVGISSVTDMNNRISFYVYDGFNRLLVIKDQNGNILKKYCYNYATQTESCAIYGNTLQTQTITKQCSTGYAGSSVTDTIPANTFYASSQNAADALAQAYLTANKQAYANAHGTCTQVIIYAKLFYENYDAYSDTYDLVVRFFSDAACTTPLSVSNLDVYYYTDLANCGMLLNQGATANGTYAVLVSGIQLTYWYDDYDGTNDNWIYCERSDYLNSGAYTIE